MCFKAKGWNLDKEHGTETDTTDIPVYTTCSVSGSHTNLSPTVQMICICVHSERMTHKPEILKHFINGVRSYVYSCKDLDNVVFVGSMTGQTRKDIDFQLALLCVRWNVLEYLQREKGKWEDTGGLLVGIAYLEGNQLARVRTPSLQHLTERPPSQDIKYLKQKSHDIVTC